MDKKIDVLEIKNDAGMGLIAGCWASDWDSLDEEGISDWFGEHRKLAFADGEVLEFSQIIPFAAACFGNNRGQALLILTASSCVPINTPAIAYLQ